MKDLAAESGPARVRGADLTQLVGLHSPISESNQSESVSRGIAAIDLLSQSSLYIQLLTKSRVVSLYRLHPGVLVAVLQGRCSEGQSLRRCSTPRTPSRQATWQMVLVGAQHRASLP